MIVIFGITALLILLYLSYPLWLLLFSTRGLEKGSEEINSVSLIILSYNGEKYLKKKINFLIREISCFQQYELIIVDDCSTDGTWEVLNSFRDIPNIRIIIKPKQTGIADSMNLSMKSAKYENIIFCDQRQSLSKNILQKIIEPLKYENIGAVSGLLYHLDKENKDSIIRRHENFIKLSESKTGCLMGVYGPFYAIKKKCYSEIPENIILDDLYLSLKILKTKQIVLLNNCMIIDEDFLELYNYNRTKRYLTGLFQLLSEKRLISDLTKKQIIMLVWHKYLRLLIPVFSFLSFICIGILIFYNDVFLILFSFLMGLIVISVLPNIFQFQSKIKNVIWMNTFYLVAFIDIFINKIFIHKQSVSIEKNCEIKTKNMATID